MANSNTRVLAWASGRGYSAGAPPAAFAGGSHSLILLDHEAQSRNALADPAQPLAGDMILRIPNSPETGQEAMYIHGGDKKDLDRLVELAVQRGEDRKSFLARLNSYGVGRGNQDAELLFAWHREMPRMADRDDLLLAASVRYDDMVFKLLAEGANPNSQTEEGITPLIYAAIVNDRPVMQALLSAGADPNARMKSGDCALDFTIKRKDPESAKILIEAGAKATAKDANGSSPIMIASYVGSAILVQLLMDHGANPRDKNNFGSSVLMYGASGGSVEVGRLLVDGGADVNAQSWDEGWTPLLKSAQNRHHDFMDLLVRHGADVNAATKRGTTALMLAVAEDQTSLLPDLKGVELLLRWGANPNLADDSGSTPLMIAAQDASQYGPQVIRTLLEHGADPNLRDNSHRTALAIAMQSSRLENAELLQAAGARE